MFNLLFILINPNISYLNNTAVIPKTSFWGDEKKIAELQQGYYDRMRDFNYLDNRYESQLHYYQTFSGRSQSFHDLYSTLRTTQTQEFINNTKKSEKNGEVSTPIVYAAAGYGAATGNTIKTNVGDTQFSETLNVSNATASGTIQHHDVKLGLDVNAKSAHDAPTAYNTGTELYKARAHISSLGFSEDISYGGTTGTTQASVGHPIYKTIVAGVDKTWSTVAPTEIAMKLGYGIKF